MLEGWSERWRCGVGARGTGARTELGLSSSRLGVAARCKNWPGTVTVAGCDAQLQSLA